MHLKKHLVVLPVLVVLLSWNVIQSSDGLVLKGHNHHGAVELLLATGILAKLLNIRAKHGGLSGHRLLHALLGGYRYQPRDALYGRRPRYNSNQLLQEEALEHHASMLMPITDADLMLNEEGHLLGKAQMFQMALGRPLPLTNSHILTASEAQLMAAELDAQELLTARRARKLLATQQARKILAEQETRKILAQEQLIASQQMLMGTQQGLMSPQQTLMGSQQALIGPQQARFLATAPSNKIISSSQGPVSAQSRELVLEEEIGNILATREVQQLYSEHVPDTIISESTMSQTHGNGQYITLQRQDVPIYPDRVIMKLHVL